MFFDGHSDIFTDITIKHLQGEQQVFERYHLPRLQKGGFEGGCFVIWVDPPYTTDYRKRAEQVMNAVQSQISNCTKAVLVHNMQEIEAAKADGKFYILAGAEGLSCIGEDIDFLDVLYDFGVREAMLTWNEQNALATGVQGDAQRGLTQFGKKVLHRMEEKGIIVDVSHLNERSFWDVMDVIQKPIVASHSNAKALCPAARNLTDTQLMTIRDANGLVGLNSFNLFVHTDIKEQTVDNLVRHAVYIADKIGVEHLGFGFDFFEFLSTDSMKSYSDQDTSYTIGLEDCSKVPMLIERMKQAGFTKKDIELVSYKNWHRIIQEVLDKH